MEQACTREHLALTRARVVAGNASLAKDVEAIRERVLLAKAKGQTVLTDVADMRARIADAKTPDGKFDAKIGKGRLQDVELTAQTLALTAGDASYETAQQISAANLADPERETLTDAADLCWTVQVAAQLLQGGGLNVEKLGEGGRRLILRETGAQSLDDLACRMQRVSAAATDTIERILEG